MSVNVFDDIVYWAKTAMVTAGVLAGGVQHACDSGSSTPTSDTPTNTPTASTNPCDTVAFRAASLPRLGPDKWTGVIDQDAPWGVLDSLWNHRSALARGQLAPVAPDAMTEDIGDIAVLQDEGDLFRAFNPYDLRDLSLRFTPNSGGGYDVTRLGSSEFRSPLGDRVTLGDDDSTSLALSFAFPFFGESHSSLFINSDGNLTFEQGDNASTPRSVSRHISGPPRVSPFLSDLDPSVSGGVFASNTTDRTTVTWCNVPGFGLSATTTVQTSLLSDGVVEMVFDDGIELFDAIVGVSPGRTGTFNAVDLSQTEANTGSTGAIGERFSQESELDLVAVAQKFFQTHPDAYDQILIFGDRPLVFGGAFAFETTVGNGIQGLGQPTFPVSPEFRSQELSSIVVMGWLGKYSDDLTEKILSENTTMGVLGHEVGHRWLAFFEFSDVDRQRSTALLGRANAHWSFFFDSDASVMEGNDIQDLGGGMFETVAAAERYSALDQYAMGLRRDTEVPSFFYVESPTNVLPGAMNTSAPQVGVTFSGTRRDVLIQDVIDIEGPRVPSVDTSPKVHRQAFIYIVSPDTAADADEVAKLDRIRGQFETFFDTATDGRMRAETRLRPGS